MNRCAVPRSWLKYESTIRPVLRGYVISREPNNLLFASWNVMDTGAGRYSANYAMTVHQNEVLTNKSTR